ncbi:MAG: HD domain-containing protein [Candidatus Kaiserbacteria bacterium]|nr:MAG: HD domain-containing protein [Candidatus Kaiserbacteria bacterium]
MKTAEDIYDEYKIMPSLQLHQLRVAAVGKLICESFKEAVDQRTVVSACLFHDMGNILKFDLAVFPEFLEPQGLSYWQSVKADYEKKYGTDQHAATLQIARELGLSDFTITCIDAVAFSKAEKTLAEGSWEEKICEYADTRVGPRGVLPMVERLEEGRKRYLDRQVKTGVNVPQDRFDQLLEVERKMEQQIFSHASVRPEAIIDESIDPMIRELRNYPVDET